MKQESESNNFNIWNKKSFIFAELYDIDSDFNSDFQIEKIVTADKKHQQVQMQQIMIQQEAALRIRKAEKILNSYDNEFWWLFYANSNLKRNQFLFLICKLDMYAD